MRATLFFLIPMITLFACNESPKEIKTIQQEGSEKEEKSAVTKEMRIESPKHYYVGIFEADGDLKYDRDPSATNKISICIDKLENGQITGRSIVAGNERPFSGDYIADHDNVFKLNMKEPGDDKYDGIFKAVLDTQQHTLVGEWSAFDTNLPVPTRKFDLKRKTFIYNPSAIMPKDIIGAEFYNSNIDENYEAVTADAIKFNPSQVKLSKENIQNMYKGDLEVLRNSIYARHGYSFKNRRVRYLFDNFVEWYIPTTTDVRNDLTELEKENIAFIKRYENHAAKYYDEYSR